MALGQWQDQRWPDALYVYLGGTFSFYISSLVSFSAEITERS